MKKIFFITSFFVCNYFCNAQPVVFTKIQGNYNPSPATYISSFNNQIILNSKNISNVNVLCNADSNNNNLVSILSDSILDPNQFTKVGTKLFFVANDYKGHLGALFCIDSFSNTIHLVKDYYLLSGILPKISNLFSFKNKLFFSADDGVNGAELWSSDGTTAGTVLIKDIFTGSQSSMPNHFIEMNNVLYFYASDSFGFNIMRLFKTDGTNAGTTTVCNASRNVLVDTVNAKNNLIVYQNKLFFSASDNTNSDKMLWVSDGTDVGTHLFKNINNTISSNTNSVAHDFTIFNNLLFFGITNSLLGDNIMVSDGSVMGTKLLKIIDVGSGNCYPQNFTECNGKLYFSAFNGLDSNGRELWATDGTQAGTYMVKDIYPSTSAFPGSVSSNPQYLTAYHNKIYFMSTCFDTVNSITCNHLFESDGTNAGTHIIRPNTNKLFHILDNFYGFTFFNDALYFNAAYNYTTYNDDELWKINLPALPNNVIESKVQKVELFPNPTSNYLEFINNENFTSYTVTDVVGNIIYKNNCIANKNNIDVSALVNGVYQISFTKNNYCITQQFIKQ